MYYYSTYFYFILILTLQRMGLGRIATFGLLGLSLLALTYYALYSNRASVKHPLVQYEGWDPSFELELNPYKKYVILLTSFRGGSSFLGKMFDENPDVLYMFEPFHDNYLRELNRHGRIFGAKEYHTEADLRMLFLQQIMHNCSHIRGSIFYEKYEFCGTEAENLARYNKTECVVYKNLLLAHQEVCHHRNTLVFKVIRMQYLKELLKIKNINSTNIVIIHSVRNPMAMMSSRRTMGPYFYYLLHGRVEGNKKTTWLSWETHKYCHETMENFRFIEEHPWFKARYLRVSHHEQSIYPIETANKVYDFLNMTLTEDLKNFLLDTTTGKAVSGMHNLLETSQNSTAIVNKWKRMKKLTIEHIYTIESQCRKLLEATNTGYTFDQISDLQLRRIYDKSD